MVKENIHIPVLLTETLNALCIKDEEFYIDATFGLGGYTKGILENSNCKVLAIDKDPEAKTVVKTLMEKYKNRLYFSNGNFSNIINFLNIHKIKKVAGITFDLGVSSPQLDQSNRGFSFKSNGPLDMRMSKEGLTAYEFINEIDEKSLANIIYELGDEVFSRRVAKAIVNKRSIEPIDTTSKLAAIIRASIPKKNFKIDAATKTFQAIRMYLNDEVNELKAGLIAAEKVLKPNGIIAVVSFHSIEDRIIKKFFVSCSKSIGVSRHLPDTIKQLHSLEIITKKPITPTSSEVIYNKRSRSAKLRIAKRTFAPSLFGEIA